MALTDDTAPPSTFQWGANGARMTPEQIVAQRKVADALAAQAGDASPFPTGTRGFGEVTQGLARVAKGVSAGLDYREADAAAKASADDNKAMIASLLGGGAAAPLAAQGTVPAAVAAAPAPDTTGKIYSNDEPSPLDPPSGQDRVNMIATALGEQPAGSPASLGVINTIRNRAVDGGYGGDTPTAVVTAPKQYSPWNDAAGRARMAAASANPAAVAKVQDAIDQTYGTGRYVNAGPNDPTEGKTHFYDPASMVPANSVPSWAQGKEYQTIGSTRFLDDPDEPAAKPVQVAGPPGVAAVAAAQDASALPAAATPTQGFAVPGVAAPAPAKSGIGALSPAVLSAMTSPYASDATKKIAGLVLAQQMKPQAAAAYKDADGNTVQVGPDGLLHVPIKAESLTPAAKDYEYGQAHPDFIARTEKTLGKGGELYHQGPDGRPVFDHKNDTTVEDVPQATVDFLADRVRMGDPSVKIGYARNPGMIAKIDSTAQQREDAEIPVSDAARNVTNNKVTLSARGSAERKLGTINTNNEFYGNNALGALDIAEKASADVPRTDYPGVNKALNAYRTQTGDPKTVALGAALNTVVNDYAKFTGGGVGTDSLRGHAEEILNGAHSPDQLSAIVHMMRLEIKRGQQSPSMVREGFDNLYAPHGSAGAAAAPAAVAAAPVPGAYVWSPDKGIVPK